MKLCFLLELTVTKILITLDITIPVKHHKKVRRFTVNIIKRFT